MTPRSRSDRSRAKRASARPCRAEERPLPRLLKIAEAAPMLSMNERQLREQVWRGHIKAVRIGRHVRVSLSVIEELAGDADGLDGR